MYLFLQGEMGIGKSYLLRQAFLPYAAGMCGYTVQRLYEGGDFAGFRICTIDGYILPQDAHTPGAFNCGSSGMPENAFMYRGKRRPEILEKAMADVAGQCKAGHAGLVLLDEIGGMELNSTAFMDGLYAVLDSGLPVAGVFKSRQNLHSTMRNAGLDEGYLRMHSALEQKLAEGGKLHTLTKDNRIEIEGYLSGFISRHLTQSAESRH